jgi:hypothetical protein
VISLSFLTNLLFCFRFYYYELTPHETAAATEGRTSPSTHPQPHEPLLVGWITGASFEQRQLPMTTTAPTSSSTPTSTSTSTPTPTPLHGCPPSLAQKHEMFFFFHSTLTSSLASHCSRGECLFLFVCYPDTTPPRSKREMEGGRFLLFSTNESFPSLASVLAGWIPLFLSLFIFDSLFFIVA